jgi:t-SNARE complex subunit (syntaxin)
MIGSNHQAITDKKIKELEAGLAELKNGVNATNPDVKISNLEKKLNKYLLWFCIYIIIMSVLFKIIS